MEFEKTHTTTTKNKANLLQLTSVPLTQSDTLLSIFGFKNIITLFILVKACADLKKPLFPFLLRREKKYEAGEKNNLIKT